MFSTTPKLNYKKMTWTVINLNSHINITNILLYSTPFPSMVESMIIKISLKVLATNSDVNIT